MLNAGLDESQTSIKIAGKNINNLSYEDDTILMAENKEELKSLLMRTINGYMLKIIQTFVELSALRCLISLNLKIVRYFI